MHTNGSEHDYDPSTWNEEARDNNCYAYASGFFDDDRESKLQPGDLSGAFAPIRSSEFTCDRLEVRMRADIPDIAHVPVDREADPCPDGTRKIALAVDPGRDFHYYRQDSDAMWSHKPGHNFVTRKDGSGDMIGNPRVSNRVNGRWNYHAFCGFYCVPADVPLQLESSKSSKSSESSESAADALRE